MKTVALLGQEFKGLKDKPVLSKPQLSSNITRVWQLCLGMVLGFVVALLIISSYSSQSQQLEMNDWVSTFQSKALKNAEGFFVSTVSQLSTTLETASDALGNVIWEEENTDSVQPSNNIDTLMATATATAETVELPAHTSQAKMKPKGGRHHRDRKQHTDNEQQQQQLITSKEVSSINHSSNYSDLDLFDINTGFRANILNSNDSLIRPFPPWRPYHSQSTKLPAPSVYVPSLASVRRLHDFPTTAEWKKYLRPLPNMTLQRSNHETENLKLHLCNGVYEAYSASYLTTAAHLKEVKSENYNLTWVNCEMASFTHMKEHHSFLRNANAAGMIVQTLDVLDFSVIHLSAYERTHKKYKHFLWASKQEQKTRWSNIDPIKRTAEKLEQLNNPKYVFPKQQQQQQQQQRRIIYSEESKRTVVVMPFLGGVMGAGHSELGNRFVYLRACFWSFFEFVPNIVVGVTRQEDVDWLWSQSGLPFFDVFLLDQLPKSAALPMATVRTVKDRLLHNNSWSHIEYIFFTESDQILISRQLPMLHEHLKLFPQRMVLPHRLMPYSPQALKIVHNRTITTTTNSNSNNSNNNDWTTQSCCLPRQNCEERKTWESIKSPKVSVVAFDDSLLLPLGNVNFLDELYRSCPLSEHIPDYCP